MKTATGWDYHPYTPLNRPERALLPYVCRIAPSEHGFYCDFIDNGAPDSRHSLLWRRRGEGEWNELPLGGETSTAVGGLDTDTDWEFYIRRETGEAGQIRLARTGAVPGTVVNYLHPDDAQYAFSGRYLCSPSLLRLENGTLLASMDVFAGGAPQNLTLIFSSEDGGRTWRSLAELFPCFWGKLFLHRGGLYMLGVSDEYGDLLIGRSYDGGKNWTAPTVLLRGSSDCATSGCHRAPMPVTEYNGRIWTDIQYGAWAAGEMDDGVISAPCGSELLDASSWTVTEFWRHKDHAACAAQSDTVAGVIGGIEGSIVAYNGRLYDFLRYADRRWLLLRVDENAPDKKPSFDSLVDLDATPSKADIIWDEKSGFFWTLCSRHLDSPCTSRNLLSLAKSPDLRSWEIVKDILDRRSDDPAVTGFQYVSFIIDGEDILFLCRTALNCPHNFHDSNYSTFHTIRNFRLPVNPSAG